MRTPRYLAFAFFSLCLFCTPSHAQLPATAGADRPPVTAAAASDRVRFAAPNRVARLRLEVLSASGDVLSEVSTKGSVLDWPLLDGQGNRLADGTYLCVVTVKDISGRITQRLTLVEVAGGAVTVRAASASDLTPRQAEAVGPVEIEAANVVSEAEAPAAALLAHDGTQGQLVTTHGDLSFRGGDFFTGRDKELMRLTADGSLEVTGSLLARGGIRFSDGTVLSSAHDLGYGRAGKGAKAGAAAGGGGATPSVTADRLAKFSDSAGTLVDSSVTESAGNVGIGTAAPALPLDVNGAGRVGQLVLARGFAAVNKGGYLFGGRGGAGQIDSEGGFFLANDGTTGGTQDGPYFILRGNQFSRIAGQRGSIFVGAGTSIAGAQAGEGAITFQTGGLDRLTVTAAGDVGVGTNMPEALLHIVGAQPPPAASGPGAPAPPALKIIGAKGGNAQSSGPAAGAGSDVFMEAGTGGNHFSGLTGARGGNVTLRAGAGGDNPGQHGGPGGSIILLPGYGGAGAPSLGRGAVGRVGVGTTAPEAALHVVGPDGGDSSNAPTALKVVGGKGGDGFSGGNGADVYIQAGDGGTNSFDNGGGSGGSVILQPGAYGVTPVFYGKLLLAPAGGSVGVGTDFPTGSFHVRGSSRFEGRLDADNLFVTNVFADAHLSSSHLEISNYRTLRAIGPKGVVGLGTSDPRARLHIAGSPVFGTGTVTSSGQNVSGSGTDFRDELSPGDLIIVDSQTRTVAAVNTVNSLTVTQAFSPNVSNREFTFLKPLLRLGDDSAQLQSIVTHDGRFGIGTTTPTATLHVNGTGLFTGNLTVTGALNATLPTGSGNYIQNNPASQQSGSFNVSGNGTLGGTLTSGGLTVDANTLFVNAANNRVGVGTNAPGNLLHVSGAGTPAGGCCGPTPAAQEVVGHFIQPSDAAHSAVSVDASGATGGVPSGRDSILYFAKGGTAIWGLRNDADANPGNKFQLRYHGDGGFDDTASRLTVLPGGNVGIGTNEPTQRLEVNGGVKLATSEARPACDSVTRGTFWFARGASGVKDVVSVCAKDAADAYAWRLLY